MKNNPLVSVNIRTFNSEKTLEKTLKSVKDQIYKNIEIIVSDGHSGDNSVKIARKYGAKVHFVAKLGDARYKDYQLSQGKYLLSLDSDQVLDKQVIEKCVVICEKQDVGAVTIAEKSIIQKGTLIENLIAYDKWLIDKNRDIDVMFGTACPRFFKKSVFENIKWPPGLSVFDDTILYSTLQKKSIKIAYLSSCFIRHHEVTSWIIFFKKFYRYGKGYFGALKENPATVASRSLPRKSYFTAAAFSKPHYFLGLLLLYFVKVTAAFTGVISYIFISTFISRGKHN